MRTLLNRRQWLSWLAAAFALVRWPARATAQDAYERSVRDAFARWRGVTLPSARIAPVEEPGSPLIVRGTLYQPDGATPAAGALVFAYHTDREGLYDRPGAPPHQWRLQGAARTDGDGRFEFRTIRPAPYPNSRNPEHVHVAVEADGAGYHCGMWLFDDDPLVPASEKAASREVGPFGWVRPVHLESDGEAIRVQVRLDPARRF